MIIFNILGWGMFFLAVLIAGLIAQLLGKFTSFESPVFLVITGVLMIVLDLGYRTTRGESSLLHPRRGGQIFFIPIWILGGGLMLFNFFEALDSKPNVSARQSNPSAHAVPFAYSPEPSYRSLKLGMISGVGSNRVATLNGQPFAEGESHTLTIGSTKQVVQCTEIREQSVVVTLSGDSQPHELKIGEPLAVNRR
jgi:hypothetical protein